MPYIHPSAVIIGNVTLGRDASVWPTAVLRGDSDAIVIGDETNVQDGVIIANPQRVLALAQILRRHVVETHEIGRASCRERV